MGSRLRSLVIAVSNAPGRLYLVPLVVIPAVLSGWAVGVLLLPAPADPLVQRLSLLAAAAGLVAFAGHPLDMLSLRHRYPLPIVAGGSLCLLLSAFCLWRAPSGVLLFRLGLPLFLTGLVCFYTFYFSVFHDRQRTSRLEVGDRFPAFVLPDSEGRLVTLAAVLTKGPVLLLFYKGDW